MLAYRQGHTALGAPFIFGLWALRPVLRPALIFPSQSSAPSSLGSAPRSPLLFCFCPCSLLSHRQAATHIATHIATIVCDITAWCASPRQYLPSYLDAKVNIDPSEH